MEGKIERLIESFQRQFLKIHNKQELPEQIKML